MAIIKFSMNSTDILNSDSYFSKRNRLLIKFISYDNNIKDDIKRFVEKVSDNKFLTCIVYLTTFKRDINNNIDYDKYFKYITNIIDILSEACEYSITDLEKKAIIYSVIIKTTDRFSTNDIMMNNIELSNFADFDLSKLPNIWSLTILGNYYLDILKAENNLKLFLKLLNAVANARNKYEDINKAMPHINSDTIWKEFEQYEIQE